MEIAERINAERNLWEKEIQGEFSVPFNQVLVWIATISSRLLNSFIFTASIPSFPRFQSESNIHKIYHWE